MEILQAFKVFGGIEDFSQGFDIFLLLQHKHRETSTGVELASTVGDKN